MDISRLGRLTSVQKLTVSGTHADTTALAGSYATDPMLRIRIATTSDIYFLVSHAGTAVTSSNGHVLPATHELVLMVDSGDIVSVIQVSAGGIATVSVIE